MMTRVRPLMLCCCILATATPLTEPPPPISPPSPTWQLYTQTCSAYEYAYSIPPDATDTNLSTCLRTCSAHEYAMWFDTTGDCWCRSECPNLYLFDGPIARYVQVFPSPPPPLFPPPPRPPRPPSQVVWTVTFGGVQYDTVHDLTPLTANGHMYVSGFFGGGDVHPPPSQSPTPPAPRWYSNGDEGSDASFGPYQVTSAGQGDAYVMAMNAQAEIVWLRQMGGSGEDQAYGLSVSSTTKRIYLTGYFSDEASSSAQPQPAQFGPYTLSTSTGGSAPYVAALDEDGEVLWATSLGSTGTGGDAYPIGTDVVVDPDTETIYASGRFRGNASFGGLGSFTSRGHADAYLVALDASGETRWVLTMGGSGEEKGQSVGIDDEGTLYTTGQFSGTATFGDVVLETSDDDASYAMAVSTNGTPEWVVQIDGALIQHATVAGDGTSYVVGKFTGNLSCGAVKLTSSGGKDGFVLALGNTGEPLWALHMGGEGDDAAYGASLSAGGSVYVTGTFSGTAMFGDAGMLTSESDEAFVLAVSNEGKPLWVYGLFDGMGLHSVGLAVTVHVDGTCYAAGYFEDDLGFTSFAVALLPPPLPPLPPTLPPQLPPPPPLLPLPPPPLPPPALPPPSPARPRFRFSKLYNTLRVVAWAATASRLRDGVENEVILPVQEAVSPPPPWSHSNIPPPPRA